jgi:hypothetical protein
MGDAFTGKEITEGKRMAEALGTFQKPLEGPVSAPQLVEKVNALEKAVAAIDGLRAQLDEALNKRNAVAVEVRDIMHRIRGLVEATYGSDSSEYGKLGFTRKSERKRPAKKTKPA